MEEQLYKLELTEEELWSLSDYFQSQIREYDKLIRLSLFSGIEKSFYLAHLEHCYIWFSRLYKKTLEAVGGDEDE